MRLQGGNLKGIGSVGHFLDCLLSDVEGLHSSIQDGIPRQAGQGCDIKIAQQVRGVRQ